MKITKEDIEQYFKETRDGVNEMFEDMDIAKCPLARLAYLEAHRSINASEEYMKSSSEVVNMILEWKDEVPS